ncbi:hypothetical protein TRM7557_01680 [Tritonibacter multivorans]|uniref:Uncharacterized protein n=1 Tax=Tritonibacter multivorans TaxID=928856 RepID=A0A0P1G8U0_9RHOB|nr:hypothetical protein [Tritonibacter multivorans]MDA7421733.1 hypothetical protein [Tritonibacter multivorans]CUH78006.1 hypothetical protein TRM7557_01680 [Tritonibacter multivorans]SFD04128.1 hypothetical protein SAMN04488049_10646 [Tritonibacter multivorans]
MILAAVTLAAAVLGSLMPLRWGTPGFVVSAICLFLAQAALNTATGFEGTSIEESLLLFGGSYVSYIGFNLQITYRAFAIPMIALSLPLVYRLTRKQAS